MAKASKKVLAWWVSNPLNTLKYGDGRVAKEGVTHTVDTKHQEIQLCYYGLHASMDVFGALEFAPPAHVSATMWKVELSNAVVENQDNYYRYGKKVVGDKRKYLYKVENVGLVIRDFLFKELTTLNDKYCLNFPEYLEEYLSDSKQEKQASFHKENRLFIKTYNSSHNQEDTYGIYDLIYCLDTLVPKRNKDKFTTNGSQLFKLYTQILVRHTNFIDFSNLNTPPLEEYAKALSTMVSTPKTKVQKLVHKELLSHFNVGRVYSTVENEAKEALKDKVKATLVKKMEATLKKASS